MKHSETLAKFSPAFVAAQTSITNPKKNTKNPFHKSKYADLAECIKHAHKALTANDIAVLQGIHNGQLRTTLIHKSGEWISDDGVPLVGIENSKNQMQSTGSAITYARRYGLSAMVGLAQEDDDGNSLENSPKSHNPKPTGKVLDNLFPENGAQKPDSNALGMKGPKKEDASESANQGDTEEMFVLDTIHWGTDTCESSFQFVARFEKCLNAIAADDFKIDDKAVPPRERMTLMKEFEEANQGTLNLIPSAAVDTLKKKRTDLNAKLGKKKGSSK